ncbi:MAG: bile acid:sodium symporter family protein [Cyclobacteriaceae bacterium]|nr:bile acid:sodium symporter family protein [Cyclobacteriaceae bacterium]
MDSTATIALVIALFIIMTGMGLSLTIDDFKRVLKYPVAIFVGFTNQIILLPIIGYVLIVIFKVDANIAMGTLILAACPGGSTSNLITHLAKGDTALSVSLTAINSLITIITIPLIVNFGLLEFMSENAQITAPIGKIAGSLLVVIALPLTIGMLIKKYSSSFADKMDKPVRVASTLVLVMVIIGIMVKEKANLADYFEKALYIAISLNLITMLIGFISARFSKLNFRQALSISIESGNQNGTLAIHVAVISLASPEFAIVAAVYSLIMYPTAVIPIIIGNKRAKKELELSKVTG